MSLVNTQPIAQDWLKVSLIGGAGLATLATLVALTIDPTSETRGRLHAVDKIVGPKDAIGITRAEKIDAARLAQNPLFVMTTGPSAYKEKTFQLFGVSISPKRKAALVAIDGAPPVWLTAGEVSGDIRLADVGTNGASFETPVGVRTINLSDAPPPAASANTGQ